ncbi:unnamed protein product [Hymenolepis diminuta]|uniref:Ovule protein n=1 Tax=Hymenolepis diminuta TaxID=6216 RepID=A0A0R3SBS1_HYMDI|nr:unnamed protein product [Hymenolepis diminuta]
MLMEVLFKSQRDIVLMKLPSPLQDPLLRHYTNADIVKNPMPEGPPAGMFWLLPTKSTSRLHSTECNFPVKEDDIMMAYFSN